MILKRLYHKAMFAFYHFKYRKWIKDAMANRSLAELKAEYPIINTYYDSELKRRWIEMKNMDGKRCLRIIRTDQIDREEHKT